MHIAMVSSRVMTFMVGATAVATVLPKNSSSQEAEAEKSNKSVKGLASSIYEVATSVLNQSSVAFGITEMSESEANDIPKVQITERRKANPELAKVKSEIQSITTTDKPIGQCPPEKKLKNCLGSNRLTNNSYLREKGVIRDTAKIFGGTTPTPPIIKAGVSKVVGMAKESKVLTTFTEEIAVTMNLEQAVGECCNKNVRGKV